MNRSPFLPLLSVALIALLLSSCASISVDKHSEGDVAQKPDRIYVAPFTAEKAEYRVDREGDELVAFKKNLQKMLQVGLVTQISNRLLPAAASDDATGGKGAKPENAWLIRGEFTKVRQGSRLLRGVVGFGAGRTKLETRVSVYDLNRPGDKPFLVFSTIGGSGAEPGAVTAIATDPLEIAVQAVASAGGGIAHGLTEDAARTARETSAELSDYLYWRGWIPREKWTEPKRYDP